VLPNPLKELTAATQGGECDRVQPVQRTGPASGRRVDPRDFRRLLLRNIAPGTLDLLVQRGLWRPVHGIVPPQYAVFDVVGRPSTIFSFNVDGLALAYCGGKHCVLEPHGTIDRLRLESPKYEEMLEATAAYDLVLPHITPRLLPAPEPSRITEGPAYKLARDLFTQSPALLFPQTPRNSWTYSGGGSPPAGSTDSQSAGKYSQASSSTWAILVAVSPRAGATDDLAPSNAHTTVQSKLVKLPDSTHVAHGRFPAAGGADWVRLVGTARCYPLGNDQVRELAGTCPTHVSSLRYGFLDERDLSAHS